MPIGEIALRVTAWASLAAWAASEWMRTYAGREAMRRAARGVFTAGGLALLAHSALAFELRHGWSHRAALQETARQTEAVLGRGFGGGLYVNYFFLAFWWAEILWWWLAPSSYGGRDRRLDGSARAFFAFMFANAAVLFAHGPLRVVGAALLLAVAWAWYRRPGGEGGS